MRFRRRMRRIGPPLWAPSKPLSHDCNIPVLSFTGELKRMTALETKPPSEIAEVQAKPLAGLVLAIRFHPDGTSEELNVDQPVSAAGGWLWLHFSLADTRACQFMSTIPELPEPARALLVSGDEHQQLHGTETSLYGILADLVCGLDGATEEIGFLRFALTETLFVSSRRHQLNAIEATRRVLRRGAKVQTPSALLETIAGQMIEALDHYAEGLAAQLDRAEERILADEVNVDRQIVGSVRRMTVRLHRQLVTLRSLIQRFEQDIEEEDANPAISLPTEKLGQRLDWLDTEIVELRDRSRLLQEEIMLKGSEQTNRSLHVLAIVTTVFLPASLVAGLFGVNVGGLPWAGEPSGFLWVIAIISAASAFVYWLLKRLGTVGRR
jgi:zinc transporter